MGQVEQEMDYGWDGVEGDDNEVGVCEIVLFEGRGVAVRCCGCVVVVRENLCCGENSSAERKPFSFYFSTTFCILRTECVELH